MPNRYTYTGREWDETLGLYHFRARMYDSVSGKFLGRDPSGYVDGQSLYRGYFIVTSVDPSGQCKKRNFECCDAYKNSPKYVSSLKGAVLCCNGRKIVCLFADSFVGVKHPVAIKITRRCIHRHEMDHMEDFDCNAKSTLRPPWKPSKRGAEQECKAFSLQLERLRDSKAKCDSPWVVGKESCRQHVEFEMRAVKLMKDRWCSEWEEIKNLHGFSDEEGQ